MKQVEEKTILLPQKQREKKLKNITEAVSIEKLLNDLEKEPPEKMFWKGIRQDSFGFIFGAGKTGKTIFTENLALSVASGQPQFMGFPIALENRKTLFISLEEFWRQRTDRNRKQIISLEKGLTAEQILEWKKNYIVGDKNFPCYLTTEQEWIYLFELVKNHSPGLVIIDSMTRLYSGAIESSEVAKEVMLKLRDFQNEMGITLIVIHHTPKQIGKPLSIDSLAGSRILAQDADFAIGINKSLEGKRYIKDVFYRYAADDSDFVTEFSIDENLWCKETGKGNEFDILKGGDGRIDNSSREAILDKMREIKERNGELLIKISAMCDEIVEVENIMSKKTFYSTLKKLLKEEAIINAEKGFIKLKV